MLELCGDVRSLNCWLGLVSVTNRWCINHECLCHSAPYRENNIETCFSREGGGEIWRAATIKSRTHHTHYECNTLSRCTSHVLQKMSSIVISSQLRQSISKLPQKQPGEINSLSYILQILNNTSFITRPYHYFQFVQLNPNTTWMTFSHPLFVVLSASGKPQIN